MSSSDLVRIRFVRVIQDFEKEDEKEGAGDSDSDMDDNVGWSTVNLDEEQKHPDVSLLLSAHTALRPGLISKTFGLQYNQTSGLWVLVQ